MGPQSHSHIFSHIKIKNDIIYKRRVKQYNEFKKKIKRKKEKLGYLWKLAVWRNIKVDKATNKNLKDMEIRDNSPKYQRKIGKIII